MPIFQSQAEADVPPGFEPYQGVWERQDNGQAIGKVEGSRLTWDPSYPSCGEPVLQFTLGAKGELAMKLEGKVYYGSLDGRLITWSDGDVWRRAR